MVVAVGVRQLVALMCTFKVARQTDLATLGGTHCYRVFPNSRKSWVTSCNKSCLIHIYSRFVPSTHCVYLQDHVTDRLSSGAAASALHQLRDFVLWRFSDACCRCSWLPSSYRRQRNLNTSRPSTAFSFRSAPPHIAVVVAAPPKSPAVCQEENKSSTDHQRLGAILDTSIKQ